MLNRKQLENALTEFLADTDKLIFSPTTIAEIHKFSR